MAASEPIVGDMGKSHRVFTAVDNRQEEHQATVTKLGTFHPGRNFAPLQTNMVRQRKSTEQD